MATPTSSSNRSKRKGTKPITQGQNPQRGNRQKVSNAQVTNSSTRGSNAGSAKVTTGRVPSAPKPADPWKAPTTQNSRTSAPKSNTTFRTQNTPLTLPNSRAQGKNLPNAAAAKFREKIKDVRPSGKPAVKPSGKPAVKPSGNYKAPSIPEPVKPTTKPPVSGVRRVGGGLVSGAILTALAGKALETLGRAAQPSEWDRVQRELQARGYGGNKPVNKDPNGRSSTGIRVSDNANKRDYQAAPTGSQQYNDYRNRQIAAERERLKGVGNAPKPVARPSASRPSQSTPSRSTASGSGLQRSSAAPQATKPAIPGRKWDDFNPGRGTSKSNNPLLDSESSGMKLRDRMKQREASQQSEAASKLSNKFGQDSGYQPQTKVDGSKYADKKPDMKKVNEYDRRKRRYYD